MKIRVGKTRLAFAAATAVAGLYAGSTGLAATTAKATFSAATTSKPKVLGDTAQDLVYVPVHPCRLVDTRLESGGQGTLAANSITAFDAIAASFSSQGGDSGDCGIPANAAAIAINMTTLNSVAAGDVRIWPSDSAMPNVAAGIVNPTAVVPGSTGEVTFNGASAIVPLCQSACPSGKEFKVFAENTPFDLTISVTGYFRAAVLPTNGLGQGLNWGTIARNTIGSATTQLRNDGTAPMGSGSLEIGVGSGTDKVMFGDQVSFAGNLISALTQVGYVVKTTQENIDAAGGAANMPAIAIEVWTSGTVGNGYSTLNYSPTSNSAPNQWSGYIDAVSDPSNAWGLTGAAFNSPATAANCGINGPRCTFAQVKALLTTTPYNAIMISAGISKGRDYAWHGEVDSLRINGTTYDFDFGGVRSVPTP